uniref:Ig-like domain-containing protein n=1 Tax=Labrus bergylta TaxID=56723 RepID=A0A3Q3F8D0_9LABR
MLGTLCTLITALTCVSAVTLVTQKPPVVTLRRGETATMDCNLGTVTNSEACWYKQIPGGVPQFILSNYHGWSSPSYGSGFSSPKFTSTHQSQTDYRLIISTVEERDSAVYYCQTWDSSVNEYVFGQGTKLIVTSSSLSPPVLTVFPPSSAELQSNKASLVCLSSQSVPFADVSWSAAGSPVSSGSLPARPFSNQTRLSKSAAICPSRRQTGTWTRSTHVECLWAPRLQRKPSTSPTVPLKTSRGAEDHF